MYKERNFTYLYLEILFKTPSSMPFLQHLSATSLLLNAKLQILFKVSMQTETLSAIDNELSFSKPE